MAHFRVLRPNAPLSCMCPEYQHRRHSPGVACSEVMHLLELWLSKLEETTFGVQDFRKHSHVITGVSAMEAGHVHKMSLMTGRPWPGPGGHIHRITGNTAPDAGGHYHPIRGWTGPSAETDSGHTHTISFATSEPARGVEKKSAGQSPASHVHRLDGSTQPS